MVRKLPTEFTEEMRATFIAEIKRGIGTRPAAAYVGISYGTIQRWVHLGRTTKVKKYRQFFKQYQRAMGMSLHTLEDRMERFSQREDEIGYKATLRTLELRSPKRWAPKPKEQPKTEASGPTLTPEAEQALAEWMLVRNEPEVQALLAKKRGD